MNVRDGEEEKVGGICTSDVTRELVARKMIFPERRHDGKHHRKNLQPTKIDLHPSIEHSVFSCLHSYSRNHFAF